MFENIDLTVKKQTENPKREKLQPATGSLASIGSFKLNLTLQNDKSTKTLMECFWLNLTPANRMLMVLKHYDLRHSSTD
jgi:hypothetical protein